MPVATHAPVHQSIKPALHRVDLVRISAGGYMFWWNARIPADAQMVLCIGESAMVGTHAAFQHAIGAIRLQVPDGGAAVYNRLAFLDVTAKPSGGHITLDLALLLKLIDSVARYDATGRGSTLKCRLLLLNETGPMAEGISDAIELPCPVQPFDGPLTFDAFRLASPRLTYPGNGKGNLLSPLINDQYYFVTPTAGGGNQGVLITDPRMRGFDCTTFPMSLFSCFPDMTKKYGTYLVERLTGTSMHGTKGRSKQDMDAFFSLPDHRGLYVIWTEGHMMLVKNATLYEFTGLDYRPDGFNTVEVHVKLTSPAFRPANNLVWVAELPSRYNP